MGTPGTACPGNKSIRCCGRRFHVTNRRPIVSKLDKLETKLMNELREIWGNLAPARVGQGMGKASGKTVGANGFGRDDIRFRKEEE